MDDTAYFALITKTGEDLKNIVAGNNPLTGKIINDALNLLGKIERQKRSLAKLGKVNKVAGKPAN